MQPIISFCITVYNQSELVKKCIESIITYPNDDIEIIICDDCSTEDIEKLVNSFNDDRIKYYRNEINVGHDRNIINSLCAASGKYAFVLRTRDLVIADAIPNLVKVAKNEKASYMTASALNQDGDVKLEYSILNFHQGRAAINAHYKLFVHPSGNIYKLSDLMIDELITFIDEENISRKSFIIHNLIRIQLAVVGDFRLIQEPTWIYTDTEKATDIAVNHVPNNISVYDPIFSKERYLLELKWSKRILTKDFYYNYLMLTAFYLNLITWGFKLENSDKQSQYHYNFKEKEFSVKQQRRDFLKLAKRTYSSDFCVPQEQFQHDLKNIVIRNITFDAFRYIVRKTIYRTSLYVKVSKLYKKYIQKI